MEVDELIPISALQHVVFCERQAALIHVERLWSEDAATARGQVVHERAHDPGADHRGGVRVLRALPLVSHRLGLIGVADLVEIERDGTVERPVPVEMKSGRRKHELADQVQLCAQALCLEEMFESPVPSGVLYYAGNRKRIAVVLDASLRERTRNAIERMTLLMKTHVTPPPVFYEAKCGRCSLQQACMPEAVSNRSRAARYLESLIDDGG